MVNKLILKYILTFTFLVFFFSANGQYDIITYFKEGPFVIIGGERLNGVSYIGGYTEKIGNETTVYSYKGVEYSNFIPYTPTSIDSVFSNFGQFQVFDGFNLTTKINYDINLNWANRKRFHVFEVYTTSGTFYDTILIDNFSKKNIRYNTAGLLNLQIPTTVSSLDNPDILNYNPIAFCEDSVIISIPHVNAFEFNQGKIPQAQINAQSIQVEISDNLTNWITYEHILTRTGYDSLYSGNGNIWFKEGDSSYVNWPVCCHYEYVKFDLDNYFINLNKAYNLLGGATNNNIHIRIKYKEHIVFNGNQLKYTYVYPSINVIPNSTTFSFNSILPTCEGLFDASIIIDSINYDGTYVQSGEQLRFTIADSLRINVRNEITSTYPYTIDNLSPGFNKVIIENSGGCISDSINIYVTDLPTFGLSLKQEKHPLCVNDTNGLIEVGIINGKPPYHYKLFKNNVLFRQNISNNTSYTFSNLGWGNYRVEVTDSNNCVTTPANQKAVLINPIQLSFNETLLNPLCFGDTNGKISIHNVVGGKTPYQYSFDNGTSYTTNNILENIGAGNYSFFLKDANNCQANQTYEISEPSLLNLQLNSYSNPICNQQNGDSLSSIYGEVNVTATGGTPSYSFYTSQDSTKIGSASNYSFINLLAGNYTCYVMDNNGCLDSVNQTITEPSQINYTYSDSVIPNCVDSKDGAIKLNITGGTPNYFVEGHSVISDYTDSLLYGDSTYNYLITDSNGCIQNAVIYLSNPIPIDASLTINHVSCFGDSTGSITTAVSGGTGYTLNYQFIWTNILNDTISNSKNLVNAPAGLYTLSITDENNCNKTFSAIITQPNKLEINKITLVKTTCKNRADGAVSINSVSGGVLPYQYNLSGSNQFNGLFTNIKDTTYQLIVTDNNNCVTDSLIILEPTVVNFNYTKQDVNCFGDSTGGITSIPVSGASPFQYHISTNNNWQATTVSAHLNLKADTFLISIEDNNNCPSDTQQVIVNQNNQIIPHITIVNQPYCEQPNGTVSYNATGGLGILTGNWFDDNVNTVNPNALGAGTFYLHITDSLSCQATDSVFLINDPSPSFHIQLLDSAYCNKPLAKTAIVIDSNTSLPYTVQWDDANNQTSDTAINLTQGSYSVVLTDNRGCVVTESITITDGAPIVATTLLNINSNCGQADGSAMIGISGGVQPYIINWNDSLNQTSDSAIELKANNYSVIVNDAVGCINNHSVIINDNLAPQIDSLIVLSQPYCRLVNGTLAGYVSSGLPPYNVSWKNNNNVLLANTDTIVNISNGTYTFEITDIAGCFVGQTVQVNDDSLQLPAYQKSIDSSACGKGVGEIMLNPSNGLAPYSFKWQHNNDTINYTDSLFSGTYTTYVADSKGCLDTITTTIVDKKAPQIVFNSKTNSDCELPTGTASVSVTSGKPPYRFVWNDPNNQTDSIATNLVKGVYRVYMIDGDSCLSNALTINIIDNPKMSITLTSVSAPLCSYSNDGKAQLNVTGLHAPFSYQWFNGQDTNYLDTLYAGQTTVYITDTIGCMDSIRVNIPAPTPLNIFNIQKNTPTCFEGCDGSIQVFAQGGSIPYSYNWNNSSTGASLLNSCSGLQQLQIQDANNCKLDTSVMLLDPPKIKSIGVPDTVIICNGQDYIIDISNNFFNTIWARDIDTWTFSGDSLSLNQEANYYVSSLSNDGCFVTDTFLLETRSDILQANFISPSQAVIGDTVVFIDVTWPPAQGNSWTYPLDTLVTLIDSTADRIKLVFNKSGVYTVYMQSYLSDCKDSLSKEIEIFATRDSLQLGERPIDNINHILEVAIYPNPSDGNFTVNVILDTVSDASITIYDLINYIQHHQETKIGSINHSYQVNLPSLQQGVYVLQLMALGEVRLFKFVIN